MVHRDIKMENILLAQNPSCLNDNLFIKVRLIKMLLVILKQYIVYFKL